MSTQRDQKSPPPISKELLEYLERLFPDRAPNLDTPDREVWAKAGEVRVVRKLRQVHEDQLKHAMQGP